MKPQTGLTQSFSLYLHLIRLAAALAVFFEHLASNPFTQGTIWGRLSAYGTIAVTIFFLLSGYVIAYVVAHRERTAREYVVGRASRLYSVIPIALLPIWALGYALYHARIRLAFPALASWLVFLASAVIVLALPDITRHLPIDNFGVRFSWGRGPYDRNLVQDYLTAAALSFNLIAARQVMTDSIKIQSRIKAIIEWAGSLTFPLYCIHYPAICLLVAMSPWPNTSGIHLAFVGLTIAALIVVVTPVCEGLKRTIRGGLARGVNVWTGSSN